jgi:hypothetical protein
MNHLGILKQFISKEMSYNIAFQYLFLSPNKDNKLILRKISKKSL